MEDKNFDRIIKEIRLNRQMQKKRLYEQAARARRKASSTPKAEGPDLKSAQCQFESDLEDK